MIKIIQKHPSLNLSKTFHKQINGAFIRALRIYIQHLVGEGNELWETDWLGKAMSRNANESISRQTFVAWKNLKIVNKMARF